MKLPKRKVGNNYTVLQLLYFGASESNIVIRPGNCKQCGSIKALSELIRPSINSKTMGGS